MFRDGLAEGFALLGIFHGFVQRCLGYADTAGRNVDAAEFQPAHDMPEALAFNAADQVFRRDVAILE